MAGATTINFFKTYIRESEKPTIVLFDNRTVVLAAALLARGCFSTGKRLNALLANINNFNLKIQHLSGKMGFNSPSDWISRNPMPSCQFETCDTCKFLKQTVESLSNEVLRNKNITENICLASSSPMDTDKIIKGQASLTFLSKPVPKQLQSEDDELLRVKFYLTSGNRALLKDNKCPNVKKYISSGATIDDGMLVVENSVPYSVSTVKVPIIPKDMARGILHSLHIKLNHPTYNQNKKLWKDTASR